MPNSGSWINPCVEVMPHKEGFSCWCIRIPIEAFANIRAAYVPFVLTIIISVTLV